MKIVRFEDIIAWQKAKYMTVLMYQTFEANNDFGFKNQIQRSSVSVMNNIAEGFERRCDKEFKHFLFIAKGSCAEVRSMLYFAFELRYIIQTELHNLHNLTIEISKMLSVLIKTL